MKAAIKLLAVVMVLFSFMTGCTPGEGMDTFREGPYTGGHSGSFLMKNQLPQLNLELQFHSLLGSIEQNLTMISISMVIRIVLQLGIAVILLNGFALWMATRKMGLTKRLVQ